MSFDREAFKNGAMMAGSHNRAAVIARLDPELPQDLLREILTEQWPMVDGSRGYSEEILALFEAADWTTDQEGYGPGDLPQDDDGEVEIYRGNVGEDPTLGFSWTLDRKQAEFFASAPFGLRAQLLGYGASRLDGGEPVATVWGSWVAADDILGYFDGRGEQEVIVPGRAFTLYEPVVVAQAVAANG